MRLLIITHTFPPSRHPNAKRPAYVAQGALAAGWEVDVLTSNIGMPPGTPESVQHTRLKIERVYDPVLRILQRTQNIPLFGSLLMKAFNGLLWPDYCATWVKHVLQKKNNFEQYDRILAFVFPPSMLKTGAEKGLIGSRWIFDYQESVSPQFEKFPRGSFLQRKLTPKLKQLEQDTLGSAGKVIFTAQSNRQAYIDGELVSAEKTEHVPYFFDSLVFDGPGQVDGNFEIRYFGGFDLRGDRNPRTFLRAFRQFLDQYPEAQAEAKFVFHGNWLQEHDQSIQELGLAGNCEIHGSLSYEDYLAAVRKSPVLLLVVASAHNLFMPSKIVDYFGAMRPILAFVPENSEMHSVIHEAGMSSFACGENDVEAGAKAIARLWESYKCGELGRSSPSVSKWSSDVQLPRYLKILEDLRQQGQAAGRPRDAVSRTMRNKICL